MKANVIVFLSFLLICNELSFNASALDISDYCDYVRRKSVDYLVSNCTVKFGKLIWVISTNLFWYKASDACRKIPNANLISIHDFAEYEFYYDFAGFKNMRYGRDYTTSYNDNLWIGLHKRTNSCADAFEWIDGTPVNYEKWGVNEPNCYQGKEFCAVLASWPDGTPWNGAQHGWNDHACESYKERSACSLILTKNFDCSIDINCVDNAANFGKRKTATIFVVLYILSRFCL